MRPPLLEPLFRPVTSLPGVGPKLAPLFDRLVAPAGRHARVLDLLLHLPSGLIDRRRRELVMDAPEGAIVTLEVRVDRHRPGTGRAPTRVFVQDESGELALVFFRAQKQWLEKLLPVGAKRFVSGRVEWWNGAPQMTHPDHIVPPEDFASLPLVEPVYPLTEGLSPKVLRKAILAALDLVPRTFPEWLDPALKAQRGWADFRDALGSVHKPEAPGDLEPTSPAMSRLAYDEVLAGQLALAMLRTRLRRRAGTARTMTGERREKIVAALPFALTGAQTRALQDIAADMAAPHRMIRLLQGDVGSGKTVVALLAIAGAVEAGGQAALMAPTELLARQHYATIAPLAQAAGLRVAVLTGRDKGKGRDQLVRAIASGYLHIVVGTHALFQEDVAFQDLALAVVDEQHRFGVHQRLALADKGRGADLLVMTATPIPRTLLLTLFGDMDVSKLDEKPAGRKPIDTRTVPMERMDEVVARLGEAMRGGAKAYWICPLVEESEASDLAAATDRFEHLTRAFPGKVGLVHGRMAPAEKDAAMAAFQRGDTRLLVATTVIEVGVDVPDATIMAIEHAERFGLAQLHQLRGRVGRGAAQSTCLLLFRGPLGDTAKARLAILRETEDGFRIAEEDLRLRGGGEVLGSRQSGMQGFRIARAELHGGLIETARDDARLVLDRDAALATPRGEALRLLLYLFGRDEAAPTLRAG